ncbi:proton-conducting transporter membrane subunit [Desulfonatronospira sp.]|uniref:complex I subunit 5 family protein n=1 Tax=Desulfonatronospira sp. TaxID=1962951 RepID=UPI0025C6EEBE|nr:proton-conducting transporter membrane subunit [Desulfonatronospira sp.]
MIWVLAVFFPLLLAGLCLITKIKDRYWVRLAALGPLPALGLAVFGYDVPPLEMPGFLLGMHLGFGEYGRYFLLLMAMVWTGAGLFAACSMHNDPDRRSYTILFLLAMCGTLGLAVAKDVVTFYAFFSLMTFTAYSLVIHNDTPFAWKAGHVYLVMAVLGEGMLIAGLMISVHVADSVMFMDISRAVAGLSPAHPMFFLLFAGFGIKAGILGLHYWLPLAHPAAPTPASAVLSGAMIKAGLLGWLYFFPVNAASMPSWGAFFMCLGLLGAFFGVLAGLLEKDPKTVLAYSSISQMGLMAFFLGLALFDAGLAKTALPGILMFVMHHGLAKAALFIGVGATKYARGQGAVTFLLLAALALPALALAGAPFTSGIQVKYLMKDLAAMGPLHSVSGILLPLSSLGTALVMAHFLYRILNEMKSAENACPRDQSLVWLIMVAASAGLPFIAVQAFEVLPAAWQADAGFIWGGLWPVLLGIVIYPALKSRVPLRAAFRSWPDAVEIMERTWRLYFARWRSSPFCHPSCGQINFVYMVDRYIYGYKSMETPCSIEFRLRQWPVAGFLFVVLTLLLAGLGIMI